jgi:hypothetical protein
MRKYVVFAACLLSFWSRGQEGSNLRSSAGIIEELKKDANAVIRLDEGILEVASPSEYTLKVHQVITILNTEGARHLHHRLPLNKFYKVDEIEIVVYNELGQPSKKYGRKDFENIAAFDGISLVTDDRVMKLYTPPPGFPCTVDIRYKVHATGYVELPNWSVDYNEASTELFRYEVFVPANLDIRQRTLNFPITPAVETRGTTKHYTWEAKNILATRLESDGFEPARYLPQVEVSPNEFSYDGYKGAFRTWQDFGAWNYKLYEETAPFSPQRIAEIQSMAANAGSREEKISLLYQYLQKNMRYVSIQLGIGGFKPFAVKFVDEKKYGDCKALTNYMRYLLQTAGILSYPALINAGHNKIPADPAFPTDPFNHVILCVPGSKDTTWLECTSNNNKAGELGTFTENKKALLLTEKGGILVNTPASDFRKNELITKNDVSIKSDGSAIIRNQLRSTGEAASFFYYAGQMKDDEQKELLIKELLYKNPEEMQVIAPQETNSVFAVNRAYDKLYNFKAGNKQFFPLCINRLATENVKPFKRETPFLFEYPYLKQDTTVFQLPDGFVLESVPANKELQTESGFYKRSCSYDKTLNRLTTVSSLALKQHVIPADMYLKMVSFFRDVMSLEEESFVVAGQAGFN